MRILAFAFVAVFALSSFNYSSCSFQNTSNTEEVSFRIQLCMYKKVVPINEVELLRQIGAESLKTKKGSVYVTKPYSSEFDAAQELPKFKALGFENAHQVVELGNELMSIQNYHDLYTTEDNATSKKKGFDVIRIWK